MTEARPQPISLPEYWENISPRDRLGLATQSVAANTHIDANEFSKIMRQTVTPESIHVSDDVTVGLNDAMIEWFGVQVHAFTTAIARQPSDWEPLSKAYTQYRELLDGFDEMQFHDDRFSEYRALLEVYIEQ
jgi:hypothetical protein